VRATRRPNAAWVCRSNPYRTRASALHHEASLFPCQLALVRPFNWLIGPDQYVVHAGNYIGRYGNIQTTAFQLVYRQVPAYAANPRRKCRLVTQVTQLAVRTRKCLLRQIAPPAHLGHSHTDMRTASAHAVEPESHTQPGRTYHLLLFRLTDAQSVTCSTRKPGTPRVHARKETPKILPRRRSNLHGHATRQSVISANLRQTEASECCAAMIAHNILCGLCRVSVSESWHVLCSDT